jgi:uncharacterized protein (DUF2062 family)
MPPDVIEHSPGRARRLIGRLAVSSTSPRRTAAAFAFGVFLSFSPFLGFQIVAGLTAALIFKWSRVALLVGLCTNLPWLILPWYTFTTIAGAAMLGVRMPQDGASRIGQLLDVPFYQLAFWRHLTELVGPLVWSFVVGTTAGAAVLGAAAYIGAVRVLGARGARVEGGGQAEGDGGGGGGGGGSRGSFTTEERR